MTAMDAPQPFHDLTHEVSHNLRYLRAELPDVLKNFNDLGKAASKPGVLDEKTKEGYLNAIPMKRLGSGEDVANACVYLASDMGAYVSGQVLSVCGALNT